MRVYLVLGTIVLLIVVTVAIWNAPADRNPHAPVQWFTRELKAFTCRVSELKEALGAFRDDTSAVAKVKGAFLNCRLQYKRIAFFLEYYFPEQARGWNGPPLTEEEPGEELKDATGLQLIEAILFGEDAHAHIEEMTVQAAMLLRSAAGIAPLLHDFHTTKKDDLESLRLELTRISTLYITGFDAPQIKSGIREAHVALSTIDTLLAGRNNNEEIADSVEPYFSAAEAYLLAHEDFDSFDRLHFITHFAMPLGRYMNGMLREVEPADSNEVLNRDADNLFAAHALNKNPFLRSKQYRTPEMEALGKSLFFEPALSGNQLRSCATCHSPGLHFTDGLPTNKNIDGKANLPRHTPTLLYAVFQHSQFWDGRALSIEEQADSVINSKTEMNCSGDTVAKRLSNNAVYVEAFKKIWPQDSFPTYRHALRTLAAYVGSLTPFRSRFDSYMNGNANALSDNEKKGFNLFMGKAQCGTCHFAPLFNGLVPPDYRLTEFEVLGTTADDHFAKPVADADPGRYAVRPAPHAKGAFKTPTVRNAAVTAPYMHNGTFTTLEKVIDFYDKGGGAGLGLDVPDQTLSPSALHLSDDEKKQLVAFIGSLTDN